MLPEHPRAPIALLCAAFAFAQVGTAAAVPVTGRPLNLRIDRMANVPKAMPMTQRNSGPNARFSLQSRRAVVPMTGTYTITDDGTPNTKAYSSPLSLNNTGQIAGTMSNSKKGGVYDCVVYIPSALKFIDMTASTTDGSCQMPAEALSDANSTGQFDVIGSIHTIYQSNVSPFVALGTSTGAKITEFTANNPGNLYGINTADFAVGQTYYYPNTGNYFTSDAGAYSTGKSLSVLQPTCYSASPVSGCMYVATTGRIVNANDVILGNDYSTYNIEEYNHSTNTFTVLTSIPSGSSNFVGLDNAGNVAFAQYNSTTNATRSYFYTLSSNTVTLLPQLSGNTCATYVPIYINGAGRVLGYTSQCGIQSDAVYWTWDATNGIHNVNAELPANSYTSITPVMMNDNGQILASLVNSTNQYHWGVLTPPTGGAIRTLIHRH